MYAIPMWRIAYANQRNTYYDLISKEKRTIGWYRVSNASLLSNLHGSIIDSFAQLLYL